MERMQLYCMSVKFSKAEMQEMEKVVEDFFARNNVKTTVPVDVFEVASSLGFDIRGAEFNEPLEGLLLVNEEEDVIAGFNSNKIIAYNCTKNIYLKKFIVAHELAHYIYAKKDSQDKKIVLAARDHEKKYYSNDTNEQRMDYIAAAILIPQVDLTDWYDQRDVDVDADELAGLVALRYNVDSTLASRRVDEVLNV